MSETPQQQTKDSFEITLRFAGNEIIGMSVSSESRTKNMIFFGIFALIFLMVAVGEMAPGIADAYAILSSVSEESE